MPTVHRTFASLRGELHRRDTFAKLIKAKTVSFFGGICLLINGMTGPGVPFTPATFQQSGWLFPSILFVAFSFVSALSVLFVIESMQAIPGNKNFQGTVEYATLINFYFGNYAHLIGQFLLYGALQANAMQSIVLMSQTFDNILVDVFGKTCALAVSGPKPGWYCVGTVSQDFPSPFENTWIIFSLGFLLVMIMSIPLGIVNLDDNIKAQIVAFCLSVAIGIEWIGAAFVRGLDTSRVPAFGSSFSTVVGTIMLNMAFTTIVPSWVNIKKREVNVQGVVWSAIAIACALYMGVGLFPALGFSIDSDGSILPPLMRSGKINKVSAYMFSIVMLLPSIPVSFIVAKGNLVQNRVVSKHVALFLAYVLPWIMCIPLQTGKSMQGFISWTSLIFVSTANFLIPLVIYLKCLKFRREYNQSRALSFKQKMLLKEIHMHSRTIHRFIDQKTANESSLAELARNQPGLLHKDRSDLGREPITPLDENPDNDGRQDPPKPGFVATLSAPDQHGDEGELITSVPPPPVERIASAPMITFGSDDQPRARSPSASGSILKKPVALSPTSGTGSRQPPSPTGSILRNPLLTPGPSGTGSRPPPSPTGSILKSPATVSGKANDGFPFPSVSPGGSVMRAASQHLDISTPPPRIPTLSFMRRQSAVRFDGHDDSDDDNRAPTPQILERGSSLRDDVGDDPQRSVDIGPITLSESQEQSGEEEYLKEDVPDPDMEHKLARMESRYGNWDVEHGPGVKNTIRRAMHTMVRRETSASLVFGGGGGSSAGGSNSRPHRRSPSPLADMETTHSRDKDSMHRPIRLQSLNTSTDDARSEASHQQSLESVGGGDGELLRQASTNTAEGTDLSDGAGLIQKKKSALPTDLMRLQTLPVHPQYISPTFRSIPTWFPVRARVVAWCLLGITGGVTIGNVVVALTGT